jgi:hypothetical protein
MENSGEASKITPPPPSLKEAVPAETKQLKPDFALDKWEYSKEDSVSSFIDRVSRAKPEAKADLEAALHDGGGKAFGLKICEMVAHNFHDPAFSLTVPEWKIVSDINSVDPAEHKGEILRSSTEDEDWKNPASGVHSSYKFPDGDLTPKGYRKDSDLKKFSEDKKKGVLFNGHYIEQSLREGCGLVVDVGYSKIAGRPLVKISSGTLRGDETRKFTSAVNDTEASVGIWDFEGNEILPIRDYHSESPLDKNTSGNFARSLAEAINKTNIDFGVQMELVINPKNPRDFQLIQLRPSPENMTRTIGNQDSEPLQEKELGIEEQVPELVLKSASVNGRFSIIAGSSLVRDTPYMDGLTTLISPGEKERTINAFQERFKARKEKKGNIAIYSPTTDSRKYYNTGNLIAVYLGKGADAIITPTPIKPNNNHGDVYGMDRRVYDLMDDCCMISVTDSQIWELNKYSEKGRKMQVISDGLIAEIRVIKEEKSKPLPTPPATSTIEWKTRRW